MARQSGRCAGTNFDPLPLDLPLRQWMDRVLASVLVKSRNSDLAVTWWQCRDMAWPQVSLGNKYTLVHRLSADPAVSGRQWGEIEPWPRGRCRCRCCPLSACFNIAAWASFSPSLSFLSLFFHNSSLVNSLLFVFLLALFLLTATARFLNFVIHYFVSFLSFKPLPVMLLGQTRFT